MRGGFDAGGLWEERSASRKELTTRFPSEDGPSEAGPASCLVAGGEGYLTQNIY